MGSGLQALRVEGCEGVLDLRPVADGTVAQQVWARQAVYCNCSIANRPMSSTDQAVEPQNRV